MPAKGKEAVHNNTPMKTALITGITSQDSAYLSELLRWVVKAIDRVVGLADERARRIAAVGVSTFWHNVNSACSRLTEVSSSRMPACLLRPIVNV